MNPLQLLDTHVDYLAEIARVRAKLYQINGKDKEPMDLPEPVGDVITKTKKVYIPIEDYPDVSIIQL